MTTNSLDSESLIPLTTAEDPITAQRWVELLRRGGIHVALQSHGTGPVDLLTQGTAAWWELRVPQSELDRARAALEADEAALPAQ